MNRILFFLIIISATLLLQCKKDEGQVTPPIESTGDPWPTFRGNFQRTGQSPFLGPQQGVTVWTQALDSTEVLSSPAVAEDGTVYVASSLGSAQGNFYAVKPTGEILWTFATGAGSECSPTIGKNNTVYFGAFNGSVYALGEDGQLKWRYQTLGPFVNSSPALDSNGNIYICSLDGNLYSFDPAGNLRWKYNLGSGSVSSPSIASDGTIYVNARSLFALMSDGQLKWRSLRDSTGASSTPAVALNGTIYLVTSGNLFAIAPNGSVKWSYQLTEPTSSFTSAAVAMDGTIYIGKGNVFLAISPDGRLKWQQTLGTRQSMESSPAIGNDGTIYIGTAGNLLTESNFFAFSQEGQLRFSVQIRNWRGIISDITSSPAICSDGTLVVGSDNGGFGIAKIK